MLKLKNGIEPSVSTWGFMVAVELQEDDGRIGQTTPQHVFSRIIDGLQYMEGVGKVNVRIISSSHSGTDTLKEEDEPATS